MRISFLLRIFICASVLLLCPAALFAKEQIGIAAGYQAFFRPGEWTPITVDIDRQGENVSDKSQGTFSVRTTPIEGDPRLFEKTIDLATQQHLRSTLYAQIPENGECQVRFDDENNVSDLPLNKDYLKALKPYQRLVLMVSREGVFSPHSALQLQSACLAHLQPEELPDLWQALESVDLIAFAQDPSVAMTDDLKRQALLQWVRFGGRILCVGGPATPTYQNSFLLPILPVTLNGTKQVDLSGRGDADSRFLVSSMALKDKAQLLWGRNGVPLAARWNVGAGEVVFCGVDLDAAASVDNSARDLWDALLCAPNHRAHVSLGDEVTHSNLDFAFGKAARLPSLLLVFFLLLAYTVLVGPVNFYILKKKRRLELAWLTIPAIVAVFATVTYVIGSATKGGLTILREMEIVSVPSGAAEARVDKISSLFSPKKRSYNLQPSAMGGTLTSFSLWRDADSNMAWNQAMNAMQARRTSTGAAGWLLNVSEETKAMRIGDRLFGQWSSQNFTAATTVNLGGALSGSALIDGDRMLIHVENKSRMTLKNAVLKIGQRYAALGVLAPNQTADAVYPMQLAQEMAPAPGPPPPQPNNGYTYGNQGYSRPRSMIVPRPVIAPTPVAQAEGVISGSEKWHAAATTLDRKIYQFTQSDTLALDQQNDPAAVSNFLCGRLWNDCFNPAMAPDLICKEPLRPCLIAWVEKSPAPLLVDATPDEYAYAGMIYQELPLRMDHGPVHIPAGLCSSELIDYSSDQPNPQIASDVIYQSGNYETDSGELIFACSPSLHDSRLKMTSARLRVPCTGRDGFTIQVFCYNFIDRNWEMLPDSIWSNVALKGENCSPVDGAVYVRMTIADNKNFRGNRSNAVQIGRVEASFDGDMESNINADNKD